MAPTAGSRSDFLEHRDHSRLNEGVGRSNERLIDESSCDRLIVCQEGNVVFDFKGKYAKEPIELMSVTKSVVAVAICRLKTLGMLRSLDVPVSEFFPEWSIEAKRSITVRHLMAHTSGLKANRTTEEIYRSSNFVELALSAEVVAPPGNRFFYNNKAVNILGAIIERASGMKMDDFAAEHLFQALGIFDYRWERDSEGNPHAMAGLSLHGEDLLKVGKLMLGLGRWEGSQLLSANLVEQMILPGQSINPMSGLLWFKIFDSNKFFFDAGLLHDYSRSGVKPKLIGPLNQLVGHDFDVSDFRPRLLSVYQDESQVSEFFEEIYRHQLPPRRLKLGKPVGYKGTGYLGQAIVVLPDRGLVAIRQIHHKTAETGHGDQIPELENILPLLL